MVERLKSNKVVILLLLTGAVYLFLQYITPLVGLIPNCAASVVIAQMYLQGAMSAGAMMSGLLVGSGVGLLVLFRVNHNRRENLKITALLYLTGALAGVLMEILNFSHFFKC